MQWSDWLLLLIAVGIGPAGFILKFWITASVEHTFNEKLETIRADLGKQAEKFTSQLRAKETEIAALRDGVLSGRANRQALLDKRRLEAVERIWSAVVDLAPFKNVSAMMASIKFDAAAKRAPHDAKLRMLFEIILQPVSGTEFPTSSAQKEMPFISPMAWAYFSAYQTIVGFAFAQAKMLELGVGDAGKLLNSDGVKKLLKTALPHQAGKIDAHDVSMTHYYLDVLEERLITELKGMLKGVETDAAAITQAAEIAAQVKKISEECGAGLAAAEAASTPAAAD